MIRVNIGGFSLTLGVAVKVKLRLRLGPRLRFVVGLDPLPPGASIPRMR